AHLRNLPSLPVRPRGCMPARRERRRRLDRQGRICSGSREPGDMLKRLFGQVRDNAVAYTALFVALSGTAFAAASAVPKNSVGTAQLKSRAGTGPTFAR